MPETREKKLQWTSSLGQITVTETVFKYQGHKVRPFMLAAKVHPRGYSLKLQRIMTDFGADGAFRKAVSKVFEHYGIKVSEYAVRKTTFEHGQKILGSQQSHEERITDKRGCPQLIGEMDGCMLPVVEIPANRRGDRRKARKVGWKETRLCLVRDSGKVSPIYGCTGIGGSTVEAGKQLERCAILAGGGFDTKIHGVGDGASWIAEQFDVVFGTQSSYLLDLYHVCDYLAAAAPVCAKKPKAWITRKKNQLKKGQIDKVLDSLTPFLEPQSVDNDNAPVRACHRYLTNRLGQLDYKSALANDLPIGSGEIESAHRHILQARLKLPGAWWVPGNANKVIALRLIRANGQWDTYWEGLRVA